MHIYEHGYNYAYIIYKGNFDRGFEYVEIPLTVDNTPLSNIVNWQTGTHRGKLSDSSSIFNGTSFFVPWWYSNRISHVRLNDG